jgi:hypothetical protein
MEIPMSTSPNFLAPRPLLAKGFGGGQPWAGRGRSAGADADFEISGVQPTPRRLEVIRVLGFRELAHGFAVYSSPALAWTRVAGDVLDVTLLAVGHRPRSANAKRGLITAGLLTAIGGLDVIAARRYAGAA